MHQFVMWRKLQLTKRATQQLKKNEKVGSAVSSISAAVFSSVNFISAH